MDTLPNKDMMSAQKFLEEINVNQMIGESMGSRENELKNYCQRMNSMAVLSRGVDFKVDEAVLKERVSEDIKRTLLTKIKQHITSEIAEIKKVVSRFFENFEKYFAESIFRITGNATADIWVQV